MALKTPKEAQKVASSLFPNSLKVKGGGRTSIPGNVVAPITAKKRAEGLFPANLDKVTPKPQEFVLSSTNNLFESQTETVTATGGTRTLTFAGQTTSALNYNASAGTIQTALEALSNVEAGEIVVTQSGTTGAIKNVYRFTGQYANKNVALIVPSLDSLTGGTSTVQVDAQSMEAIIAREKTQAALASMGLLRKPGQVTNDMEKTRRVPKDIGDPTRTPGEDY